MRYRKLAAALALGAALTCAAHALPADAEARWKTLSETEKSQVYGILEERARTEYELLEKYVQLGLLDERQAAEIRHGIDRRLADMKSRDLFPGVSKGPREEGRRRTL